MSTLDLGSGGRMWFAPPGTLPPPRTVCLRYQEVDDAAPGGLRFSCECAGEGCPHQPGRRWHELGVLDAASVRFEPQLPEVNWDATREAFEQLGRGIQAMTVSFRASMVQFSRLWALAGGPDAPRHPYVSRIRSDYRRRARARVRRGRR